MRGYRMGRHVEVLQREVGSRVQCAGWISSIRRVSPTCYFIDIKDSSGKLQIYVDPGEIEVGKLHEEMVVSVRGELQEKPKGKASDALAGVEVRATDIEVLNDCRVDALPFPTYSNKDSGNVPDNDQVLPFRYLQLRNPQLQANLRARHRGIRGARKVLDEAGFLEVETPTLFRSTPEGAREFIVPTRYDDLYYSLVQSPQQYKQLLMVGGVDRYYQIARCYRDEDSRSDRQPEFTQLDMEMAFVRQEDVLDVGRKVFTELWNGMRGENIDSSFPQMTYAEAMTRFGSDKPDTRLGVELVALGGVFEGAGLDILSGTVVGCKGTGLGAMSKREVKHLKEKGDNKVMVIKVVDGKCRGDLCQYMDEKVMDALIETMQARHGDVICIAAGEGFQPHERLGKIRPLLGVSVQGMAPDIRWVVDFPLFERQEDGSVKACHHPFTAPSAESLGDIMAATSLTPELVSRATSQAYDLVVNGMEVGGGSIRMHQPQHQNKMLALLGRDAGEFGHLVRALSHGAPPHGGIAFGLDRIAAVALEQPSLRDVIAFPKNSQGVEPMVGSPGPVDGATLAYYGIA